MVSFNYFTPFIGGETLTKHGFELNFETWLHANWLTCIKTRATNKNLSNILSQNDKLNKINRIENWYENFF